MGVGNRSTSLKRIERLYGLVENMHAVRLQEAAAKVREAENAIAAQQAAMLGARMDARTAMAEGNREEYAVADVQRVVGGQRQDQLETIRLAREEAVEAARVIHDASRVERGQIKTVLDAAAAAERLVAGRQAQAWSDDRFLSRLSWNRLRDESA